MKKKYYLTIDTETAGDLENPLVYDMGGAVHDKQGNIVETFSFIIWDIFKRYDLMESAYYSDKITSYIEDINNGTRKIVSWDYARAYVNEVIARHEISTVIAYNARFDWNAIRNTNMLLNNGRKGFFPWGVEIWDSWKMARDVIATQKSYPRFCEEHGFMTNHKTPRPQTKAETMYRYMKNQPDFIESHTGLEDVLIEVEIFARCIRQHKPMRKLLFEKQ